MLNQQGYLIERKVWVRPKSSQWLNEIFTQMEECEFKEHFRVNLENLNKRSKDFEPILGFPQCIGAVDGRLIPISAPRDQAISYYNYKGWYSIVLFAVVDCRYRFTYISVGSPGRNNDSYILQNSSLKATLESHLFEECCKELGDSFVPLCLIGDSAFPLTRHLLKPYHQNLELSEI
ncbi:putative nuclease HARBI1 [Hydra vulgaris]|uniref:putative nuclease HARBI1 n=1 Tax=Hydra vulgaris TaxID=6087 RepID=UPI001F5E86F2|nr:putative nuclease HARBI1 [Hydra vulgaris]